MAGCLCILYQYDKLLIAFRNTQSNKYTFNNFVDVRLLLSHGTFCKHFSQQDKCDPLTYHFDIVKLGYEDVYIFFFFLIFAQNIDWSRDVRKPVFGISEQVRHKPGWKITEDG